MSQEYPHLKKFLAARFHQDWTDEGTADEVVLKFLRKADPWERVDVANDTVRLLADKITEEQLEHFCGDEARSDIYPPGFGKSYRMWLVWLSETVRPRKAPSGPRPAPKVEPPKPVLKQPVHAAFPPVKITPTKSVVLKSSLVAKAVVEKKPAPAKAAVKKPAPAKKPAAKAAKPAAKMPAAKKPAAKAAKPATKKPATSVPAKAKKKK